MAGIQGLDVTELQSPYRDPRAAFRGSSSGIPGLDVSEIYDPARTQVARRAPSRPNFTMPGAQPGAAPVAAAPPQITGGPGTALVPRQNFTMGPDISAFDPAAAPKLASPPLPVAAVNPDIAAAARVRTAGIPGSPSFQGPQAPVGAPVTAAAPVVDPAAPGRFAAARAALNTAVPTPAVGEGAFGAVGKAAGALARGVSRFAAPVAGALEAGQTVRDSLAPDMTGLDIAGRVAEGAGRVAGMGAGAAAGAAAGTAILPGVGTVIGGALGGGAGYFAPDIANKAYNWITGGDNQLASATAAQNRGDNAPAAAPPVAAPPPVAAAPVVAPRNIGPMSATADQPLVPTDSTATPQAAAPDISKPQPFSPTLDASTQLALTAAKTAAAGRVDPGVSGGGVASLGNNQSLHLSDSPENAGRTRQMQMTDLDHIARLGNGHDRAGAIAAMAALSQAPLPGQAIESGERVAAMRESGELARANAANSTNRAIHGDANDTARRGQDIGLVQHTQATKNAMDIAALHNEGAANVANITSEGRIDAAMNRSQRPVVVGGGQEPYTDPATGMTMMRTVPSRVVDGATGLEIGQAAPKAAPAGTPPPPKAGDVIKKPNGSFKYKGGDASDPTNWEKV